MFFFFYKILINTFETGSYKNQSKTLLRFIHLMQFISFIRYKIVILTFVVDTAHLNKAETLYAAITNNTFFLAFEKEL